MNQDRQASQAGQTLAEYALVLALLVVSAVVALMGYQKALNSIWEDLSFWLSLPSP